MFAILDICFPNAKNIIEITAAIKVSCIVLFFLKSLRSKSFFSATFFVIVVCIAIAGI